MLFFIATMICCDAWLVTMHMVLGSSWLELAALCPCKESKTEVDPLGTN